MSLRKRNWIRSKFPLGTVLATFPQSGACRRDRGRGLEQAAREWLGTNPGLPQQLILQRFQGYLEVNGVGIRDLRRFAVDDNFRPLTPREMGLLRRLLEREFPGRDQLREQLGSVTGRTIDEEGSLALQCRSGPPAPVLCRVPAEGECMDTDGKRINVLLHVVRGFMNELEVYKDDSSAVLRLPSAGDLMLTDQSSVPAFDWSGKDGLNEKRAKSKRN